MARHPRDLLPLKDLVFRILLSLADGEQPGSGLAQALDDASAGDRLLPGHLYRTLDRMLDDGLIEERDGPSGVPAPAEGRRGPAPSRYFSLTLFGREVARAETRRLEGLVARARASSLSRARR